MPARYLFAALVLAIALAPSLASAQADCDAPEPVCAARGAVFALSSPFDPLASAVLVAPGELVTNRHVVAAETRVALRLADGRRIEGEVVPGAYRGDLVLVRVPGLSGTPLARAYRRCIEVLDEADATEEIAEPCRATGNRELLDLAAQTLGRAGNLAASEALFREALTLDTNSVNSLLGLAVPLHLAERWRQQVAVLRNLIETLPTDFRVLRMSVQAAKHAGESDLAERALALIEKQHPDAPPEAREFLAD